MYTCVWLMSLNIFGLASQRTFCTPRHTDVFVHLLPSISQLVPWAPSNWSSKPRMECYMVGLLGSLHHCGGPVCQGVSNLGMASTGRKACPCPKICEDTSKCKCICILYKIITSNCCTSYVCHLSQSPPGKSHC